MIRSRGLVLVFFLLVFFPAACRGGDRRPATACPQPNYELVCRASNTKTEAQLFCMRNDTRTGEVLKVELDALPVSQGPTRAATKPAGHYHLECGATSTETRADVTCIRLDTETGDMLLVALPKVGEIP